MTAAGHSVTVAGLTATWASGTMTTASIAAAFANLSSGATSGSVPSGGTVSWSGTLTGYSSGAANSSTVIFTSTLYEDVATLATSGSTMSATATPTNGGASNASATDIAAGLSGKVITISANAPADLVFQGGADTSTPNMITYDAINIRTDSTSGGLQAMNNLGGQVNLINSYTTATAQTAWATAFSTLGTFVDAAVDLVSEQRSVMGALQNRISYINQNLEAYSTNLQSSRSAIMDTDFAAETAKLTKGQIMQQAATAMLAQANQMPNVVLSLLK